MINSTQPKIAIVDDDAGARESLSMLLRSMDYNISAYSSAEDFLNVCESEDLSCVVTDLRLKGMNGVELIKKLSEKKIIAPVILLSAFAKTKHITDAYTYGVFKVLDKPYEDQEFWDTINHAINEGHIRREKFQENELILEKFNSLSESELKTLQLILNGKNNKEISFQDGVTQRAVELRRKSIISKFEVENLTQVCVALAKINRLLPLSEIADQ